MMNIVCSDCMRSTTGRCAIHNFTITVQPQPQLAGWTCPICSGGVSPLVSRCPCTPMPAYTMPWQQIPWQQPWQWPLVFPNGPGIQIDIPNTTFYGESKVTIGFVQ
jgi:hypothetical protein